MTAPPSLSLWRSLPRAWRESDGTRVSDPVRVASTTPFAATFALDGPLGRGRLSGAPSALDGVALVRGDRVLVKDHAAPLAPGVYVVSNLTAGIWDRAPDCVGPDLAPLLTVMVMAGTLAGTIWRLVGANSHAVDVDPLSFEPVDPSSLSILEALVRTLDAELGTTYDEIRGLAGAHDPFTCEPRFLHEIAGSFGWQLDGRMPLPVQRKLVAALVILYRRKGTRPGIAALLRLVTGSEVRVRAARASGWRLGRSRLGLRAMRFVAAGLESSFDITPIVPPADTPEGQYRAETFGELTVLLNGVKLTRAQVRQPDPRTVVFCRGTEFTLRAGEQSVTLDFDATLGLSELEFFVNGEPLHPGPGDVLIPTPNTLTFAWPVFDTGDVLVVRSSLQRAPPAPGDEVVVKVPPAERTRLATALPRPWPTLPSPDQLAAYDRARTLLVDVARRLQITDRIDEHATVGDALATMASSKARPVLTAPHVEPRRKWVLGRSRLGRDTRC